MDNRIKAALFGFAAIVGAVFIAFEIGSGNFVAPALLCIGILSLAVVLLIGRECPFDGAVLTMLIAGIWITGKGAVFINVGNLVYVSEIILGMLLVGYAVRVSLKIWPIFPPVSLAWPITLYLLYGVLHIVIDFRTFGFMTLRDACIVYYSGFFLATYQLARTSPAFVELLKKMAILGAIGAVLVAAMSNFGAHFIIVRLRNALQFGSRTLFYPHPDASDAVIVGLMVFFIFLTLAYRRYSWLAFLGSLFCLLVVVAKFKGALMIGLFTAFAYVALAGQWWVFRRLAIVGICVAVILTATSHYYPEYTPDQAEKVIHEIGSIFAPFQEKRVSEETSDDRTVEWRLFWWGWVIRETMDANPFYGMGLGQDLAIGFEEEFRGRAIAADQSAIRGVHNSMLTIFGRMGIIGAAFFVWITGLQAWFMFRAARLAKRLGGKAPVELTLYAGYLCGMVGSTFFQYGWDAPYSAIPFWTCLALLVWRVNQLEWEFSKPSLTAESTTLPGGTTVGVRELVGVGQTRNKVPRGPSLAEIARNRILRRKNIWRPDPTVSPVPPKCKTQTPSTSKS